MGQVLNGRQQFLDSDGTPLVGGRVAFYLPNTLTPIVTYQDEAQTIPNTNPIILDGGGFATIWYNGLSRQIVTRANGNLLWDKLTGAGGSGGGGSGSVVDSIADLRALQSGDAEVLVLGYYAPADGGGGTFWLDANDTTSPDNNGTIIVDALGNRYKRIVNGPIINAQWFGTKGDNVADDTGAINDALALQQPVMLADGVYKITGSLTLVANGQSLMGSNTGGTTLQPTGNFNVIVADNLGYVRIANLLIAAGSMGGGYAISFRCYSSQLENIFIQNPYNGIAVNGTVVAGSFDLTISNVACYDIRGTRGFSITGGYNSYIRLLDCVFGGNVGYKGFTGIYIEDAMAGFSMTNVVVKYPQVGVHLTSSTASNTNSPYDSVFVNVSIEEPALEAYRFSYPRNVKLIGCNAKNGGDVGMTIDTDAWDVSLTTCHFIAFQKETIVIAGQDVKITNSQLQMAGYPSNVMVYDQVRITGTAQRIAFSNSHLGGLSALGGTWGKYGASIAAGAINIRFDSCDFYGNALGYILDNSGSSNPGNVILNDSQNQNTGPIDQFLNGVQIGVQAGFGGLLTPTIIAGQITAVAVGAGGYDYTTPTVVAIDSDFTTPGSGFVGTATVVNGVVTAIAVVNPGAGYHSGARVILIPSITEPTIRAIGPTANHDLRLLPKGTGALRLGGTTAGAAGAVSEYLIVQGPTGATRKIALLAP